MKINLYSISSKDHPVYDTIGERFDVEIFNLEDWPSRVEADGVKNLIVADNYLRIREFFRVPEEPGYDDIPRAWLWNDEFTEERGRDIAARYLAEPFVAFVKHRDKRVLAGGVLGSETFVDPLLYSLADSDETFYLAPVEYPAAEIRVWVIDGQIARFAKYQQSEDFNSQNNAVLLTRAIFELKRFGLIDWEEKHGRTYSFDVAVDSAGVPSILEIHHPHCVGDYGGYAFDLVAWLEASTRWLLSHPWVHKPR